jgi:hypothetical protein
MSFWGGLGKVLSVAAPIAAAPFTGGGSLAMLPAILGGVGQIAAGASKGSADQRLAEQGGQLQQQALRQQQARDTFDSGLRGAQFQSDQQDRGRKAAMLQAMMGNMEDVKIGGMNPRIAERTPQISGGLRPSAITGGGGREALMALLAQQGPQAPEYQAAPGMQLPGQGMGEKVLGGIGLGSSIFGALGPLLAKRQQPQPEINL